MSVNVKSYSKPKSSTSGGSGSSGGGSGVSSSKVADTAKKLSVVHTIWGNDFNGTQDVEGNLTIKNANLSVGGTSTFTGATTCKSTLEVEGNVTCDKELNVAGSITAQDDISSNGTITANTSLYSKGNLKVDGSTNVKDVHASSVSATQGNFGDITSTAQANLRYVNISGHLVNDGASVFNGKSTFKNFAQFLKDIDVEGTATINNLNVTGEAHFYNTIIDEVKSVGGQIIVSCANGTVQEVDAKYKLKNGNALEVLEIRYLDEDYNVVTDPTNIYYLEIRRLSKPNSDDTDFWKTFCESLVKIVGDDSYIDGDNYCHLLGIYNTEDGYDYDAEYIRFYNYDTEDYWAFDDTPVFQDAIIDLVNADYAVKPLSFTNRMCKNISEYITGVAVDSATATKVKWKAENKNTFTRGDHVLCHQFNADTEGKTTTTNKHYWTLCIDSGTEGEYNYIILLTSITQNGVSSGTINGWKVNPEEGDNLIQLGHLTDADRQSALVFSAYAENVIDSKMDYENALKPPFFAQYVGINDYTLVGHLKNYFSRNKNQIQGELKIENGKTVEDAITDAVTGQKMYVYTAFCNNPSSGDGFTITPQTDIQYNYMSVITSILETQPTNFKDYKNWFSISGTETDTRQYRLITDTAEAVVSTKKVMTADMKYKVVEVQGTTASIINSIEGHTLSIKAITNKSNTETILTYNSDTQLFEGAMTINDFNEKTDSYIIVNLLIDNNVVYTTYITITFTANTLFEITDGFQSKVNDIYGNITNIKQTTDNISLSVTNLQDNLKNTGINIEDRKIVITANNFYLTNNYGERVLETDSEGNLVLTGIIKPKNIQLETKKFFNYPNTGNVSQSDMMECYVLKKTTSNLLTCDITFTEELTINRVEFGGFCTVASTSNYTEYTLAAKVGNDTLSGVYKIFKGSLRENDKNNSAASKYYSSMLTINKQGSSIHITADLNKTVEASKYGVTYLSITYKNSTNAYGTITLNINDQLITSYEEAYDKDMIKQGYVNSFNLDMTNYEADVVTFNTIAQYYKVNCMYWKDFYDVNKQLYYYYNVPNYCSGIYDFTWDMYGGKIGYYNEDGSYTTQYDETNIHPAIVVVLPMSTKNEDLTGVELTFLTNKDTNIYLVAEPNGNTPLKTYTASNGWLERKGGEDLYFRKISDFYKMEGGVTKVMCTSFGGYAAQWVVTNHTY